MTCPVRSMVVLLGSALLLVVRPAVAQRLDPVARYSLIEEARAASRNNDHAKAATLYRQLATDYPDDPDVWMAYLESGFRVGKSDLAAAERAVALGTGFPRERLALEIARAHAREGHKEVALSWIERALEWRLSPRTVLQTDSAFASYRNDPRFRELAGMPPGRPLDRVEGWRLDLDFLDREAKRLHASFDRVAYSPAFDAAVREIRDRIPQLTDRQIVVELQRLIVLLGDGHSKVNPHPAGKMLPVDFYFFSDGVFIVSGVGEGRRLVGSEVLKFGSRTTAEMIEQLPRYVNRDNPMGVKWIGAWTLSAIDFVQAMGGTDDPDRATLTIREPGGPVRAVTLEGGELRRIWPQKLPRPDSSDRTPLYLRNVASSYWFAPLPEANAVYFQFNQVRERPDEPIAAFAPKLLEAVRDPSVKNLIIDVRHNSGGNSYLYPPFLRIFAGFQDAAPDHRLFYITGRNTFSAAQNFSTNVERLTNALFVGEPTGASPNFVGEGPILFDLPYSKTKATISNWYHQFSFWPDRRPWIAPDIPAELSSRDYFENRDPALDAVLAIIRARGQDTRSVP